MLDPKLKVMVFQIQERIVGNGLLTKQKRIFICVFVFLQLVIHLDKEQENSQHL